MRNCADSAAHATRNAENRMDGNVQSADQAAEVLMKEARNIGEAALILKDVEEALCRVYA
jgi:hypothetical protein